MYRTVASRVLFGTLLLLYFGSLAALRRRQRLVCAATLAVVVCAATSAHAVTFDWATVGNPGNADDIHGAGYGGVDYTYRISKHEVTNAQYTEFLNAVAASDTHELYHTGMGSDSRGGITRSGASGSYTYSVKAPTGRGYTFSNKPVVYVSFFDAMRFVNWLHNGQGFGDTESGVYTIGSGTNEVRSAGAKFWIPSEDEWYKAAYYDPNGNAGSGAYYHYSTSSDTRPNNNLPSADTGNSANFYDSEFGTTTGSNGFPMTDVGAYTLSKSPYGTFDQGGNVLEWNEAVYNSSFRKMRGGSHFHLDGILLSARFFTARDPTTENPFSGFRVASIPEPSTFLLGAVAGMAVLWRRRRVARRPSLG